MNVIIGLGNPGKEYAATRHNVGFLFVEYLLKSWGNASFSLDKKLEAETVKVAKNGSEYLLVKPQTFMNSSGRVAQKAVSYYKLNPAKDIIAVYDDLDIPFSKWKLQKGKGPRIHNGVNSLVDHLKTQEFWHLRVGIGSDVHLKIKLSGGSVADEFILKPFSKEEREQLPRIFATIVEEVFMQDLL